MISDYSSVRSYNPLERLMFSAAAHDESSARHFHAFGSRSIGVREFLAPRALGRALWVNARRSNTRSGTRRLEPSIAAAGRRRAV